MKSTLRLLATASVATLMGASGALAADFDPVPFEPAPMEPVMQTGGDWDGFYLGIFGGYGVGEADHTSLDPGNDIDLDGWLFGGVAGVNFYLSDQIVGGVEADIAWSDLSGSTENFLFESTHSVDWMGSLRGRLGFDGGSFMPYVTGGLAFAHAERTTSFDDPNSASAMHYGWTAGAGVEIAATDNLNVDLQYRYTDLSGEVYDWSGAGTNPTVDLTTHTATVGLKWQIN